MAAAMQPRRNAGLSLNAAGQPQLATAIYNRGGGGITTHTLRGPPGGGEGLGAVLGGQCWVQLFFKH